MSRTSSYAESYTAANSDESARLTELRGIEAATAPAPRRQLVETRTSAGSSTAAWPRPWRHQPRAFNFASLALPERAAEAFAALLRAMGEVADPTPCRDDPRFTSDDLDDRQVAAGLCEGCPVIELCGNYAEAAREVTGVWGGQDRTLRRRARDDGDTAA